MTREEFFAAKNKGALWDVGVSINRTNPLPLDKNAVFDTYENALTYAKGVLAYPGQFIAVVGEDAVTGYLITVAGGEGATLVKLAQTSGSGDVSEQLNTLSTKVNNIVNEIGKASTDSADATGLYKLIEANKKAITVLNGTGVGSVSKAVDDAVKSLIDGAPETFDTFKEIATWINDHGTDATAMTNAITKLEAIVKGIGGEGEKATVVAYVTDAINALKNGDIKSAKDALTALAGRVDGHDTKLSELETAIAGVKVTAENAVVANASITGGTATKVTFDSKGLITGSSSLVAEDIPNIAISQVDNLSSELSKKQNNLAISDKYSETTSKIASMKDITDASDAILGDSATDTEASNTLAGLKKYVDKKASDAESNAKADAKNKTDALDTRLKSVEDAVGSTGSISEAISKAKQEAIDAAATDATTKVNTAKTDILGAEDYAHTVKDAYELANGKTTMADVEAKGYATKSYVDTQDSTLKGTATDKDTEITIYGARKLAQKGIDDAAAAKTAADNYNTALTNTISTVKSDLLGSTEDDSTKETIRGARKYSEAKANAVLGTAQDTASEKTVYGAFAAAKAAQNKANANETAIGSDTIANSVKGRIKTLETTSTSYGTRITKNESDIASLVGNMSGVFHFKGAATKTGTELYVNGAQVVEKAVGDVYTVGEEEYAWSGSAWIMLGITTDLSNYYDKSAIDKKIAGFSGAFHFKGVAIKFNSDGSPIVPNPAEGDVWLDKENAQWAWNGEEWIKLGFLTDLTGYATIAEVDAKIEGALQGLYTFKGEIESLDNVVSPIRGDVYVVPQKDGSKKQYAYSGDGNWVEISTNVDLSAYALTTAVDEKVRVAKNEAVTLATSAANTAETNAKAYTDTQLDALKGGSTKTIKEIQTVAESAQTQAGTNANAITAINTSLTETGTIGKKIKANADAIKALQEADYTGITSEKIAQWDAAQPNVIEKIQVNGTEIAISEKTVNIPLATAARAGLIISSNAENAISVSDTGVATVNSINVNKLVQTAGDELILNGGNA